MMARRYRNLTIIITITVTVIIIIFYYFIGIIISSSSGSSSSSSSSMSTSSEARGKMELLMYNTDLGNCGSAIRQQSRRFCRVSVINLADRRCLLYGRQQPHKPSSSISAVNNTTEKSRGFV